MNPQDPYGVPTGSVPRVSVSGYQRTEPLPDKPMTATEVRENRARWMDARSDEAVNKCIDDYLLMERKARAWDALRAQASKGQLDGCSHEGEALAYLDTLMRLDGAEL